MMNVKLTNAAVGAYLMNELDTMVRQRQRDEYTLDPLAGLGVEDSPEFDEVEDLEDLEDLDDADDFDTVEGVVLPRIPDPAAEPEPLDLPDEALTPVD